MPNMSSCKWVVRPNKAPMEMRTVAAEASALYKLNSI